MSRVGSVTAATQLLPTGKDLLFFILPAEKLGVSLTLGHVVCKKMWYSMLEKVRRWNCAGQQ